VAPHLYGAGIQYKLSEVMGYGLPSVVSELTAAGFALEDGQEVLIGSSPSHYAQQVVDLYTHEALWKKLQTNMIRFIKLTHNENILVNSFTDILDTKKFEMRGA